MLLLFDIDGTLLIKAADEHRRALQEALVEVHRGVVIAPGQYVETAGRTDGWIARAMLMGAGVDAARIDQGAERLRAAACAAYARLVPDSLERCVNAGVPEALDALAQDGHTLSLVTGNFEPIARLKLRAAGLGRRFSIEHGGFGSDSEDRTDLPAIARARAGEARAGDPGPWPREDTVVIGDTPLDIACARADGVRVIGIATGPHPAEDLVEADAVVASASELPEAVAAL